MKLSIPLIILLLITPAFGDDPYEHYVLTSKDFKPIRQDKAWALKAFPSWLHMPWAYQWTIGYTADSGKWSVDHGYNGAMLDRDGGDAPGKIDWINQFKIRFYVDHVASKGFLHLWDGGEYQKHAGQVASGGIRVHPVNAALKVQLEALIRQHLAVVKTSPWRAAYALDDEISWGSFVRPFMWCVTDDAAAYPRWLTEIYGPDAPSRNKWVTYEDIRPRLKDWTIARFDASPLMDQWTFNDSYWLNFIGDLVEFSNSIDPRTPCGFVGGQCPNAFGGYDYAKVMRKIQYIEAYNLGSSQAIIRSFNPHGALPVVTSIFHTSADDDIWQTWYYLAHGNRGFIGWVEKWFDGKTPLPWHDQVAPTYLEAANKIGPLMCGAEWMHDGVGIYYSHASIQLGWIMDAAAHGKTWINRNGDDKLGMSHRVRHAWENMLRDSGIQYNFVSYVDVIQHGLPDEYKVLVLPGCFCLSDAEARRIRSFCSAGGTVIADYLPGMWDQHGKGRPNGGALDDLFGIRQNPALRAGNVFNGEAKSLWTEVDEDSNFSSKDTETFLTHDNTCIMDDSRFNKAVRNQPVIHINHFGKGTAVLMNLSPQWYNAYRTQGQTAAAKRDVFMKPVLDAGIEPIVSIKNPTARTFGAEITCFKKDNRWIIFLCQNPELTGGETGGGNATGLKTDTVRVTLKFRHKASHVRDERMDKDLGQGDEFSFDWVMNQAVVLSCDAK